MFRQSARPFLQTNKGHVSPFTGPGEPRGLSCLILLFFADLLTLVKFFSALKKVKKCQPFLRIFLCAPPCFITAGHFPTLSRGDQRARIDIHPSLSFMKAKSFTGRKEPCRFSSIQFAPPPCPALTFSPFYHRKRNCMSARVLF